ncbi:MAG TPA: GNAT family N-acetyltransferase, partial [Armatimonadota bacterium]
PEWTAEKEAELSRAGIVLETFKGEHISLLTDFLRAEFPGDWQRLMRETMLSIVREESAADRVLLATENGRCVGFCQHDGERFGPFGVALSHRGRGIGAVLLGRCLKNMAARGFYRAWLMWTDDRASRLYSAFGFRETRRYSVMKRNIR